MASAHSTSVQSSIHEKDKGRATDARQGEKLMDGRHHRRDGHTNGNNDERNRGNQCGRE